MKRHIIQLIALLFFTISSYAQTNGSFETLTGTNYSTAFSSGQVTGWKQSHGTPSITSGAPGYGSRAAWMWSYSGKGEGIVQPYAFSVGSTYTVSFWVRTNNPDGQFYVKAANSVPNGTTTSTTIPSVTSQNTIYTGSMGYANWTQKTITFVPTAAYSQLWIYPYLASYPTNGQAELMIDGISISVCTPASVYVPNNSFELLKGTSYSTAFSSGQVPGWKQSHGTPSITSGATGQGNRAAWMWSYSGNGEGIVSNVSLTSGKTYKIKLWVRTNNPDGVFYVKAANNVPAGTTTSISIPSVSSQQTIYSSGLYYSSWVEKTITFTANGNYSQLWIYPYLASYPTNGQAELMIDNIRVETVCGSGIAFRQTNTVQETTVAKPANELQVSVYPNPTAEIVSLQLPEAISEVQVAVYDLVTGKKVGTFKATQDNSKWSIPTHIKDGMYQMVVTDAKSNTTKSVRLIVNRK